MGADAEINRNLHLHVINNLSIIIIIFKLVIVWMRNLNYGKGGRSVFWSVMYTEGDGQPPWRRRGSR